MEGDEEKKWEAEEEEDQVTESRSDLAKNRIQLCGLGPSQTQTHRGWSACGCRDQSYTKRVAN